MTTLTKRVAGVTYVFAIGDGNRQHPDGQTVNATIAVRGRGDGVVHVLGENRVLALRGGRFVDRFRPYQHHVYQIRGG